MEEGEGEMYTGGRVVPRDGKAEEGEWNDFKREQNLL